MGFLHNLKYKLLVQVLFVVVSILLVYTVIWITITKNQIINTSSAQVKDTASIADLHIQKYFSVPLAELTTYAGLNSAATNESLDALLIKNKYIENLSILSPNGQELAYRQQGKASSSANLQDKSQMPEFKIAGFMGGQTYVSPVFQQDGKKYVHIATPLEASPTTKPNKNAATSSSFSGILVATILINPLFDELNSLKIGKNGYIFIVDEKGTLLNHPENAKVPNNQEYAKQTTIDNPVRQENNDKGEEVLTYHTANALTAWGIIAQVPLSDILQPLNQIIMYAVLLFIGVLTFAALLSLTLGNGVVMSFQNLRAGFENFNKGNLAFRIEVTGQNEIDELSQSMNNMIGDIHQAHLKVEKEAASLQLEKDAAAKAIREDQERMQKTLVDEKSKVNYGLFAEKEKTNAILSNITDAVILLNKNRQFVLLNKKAEELLGYSSAEMQNKLVTAAIKLFEKDREMSWDEYAPLKDMSMMAGNVLKKEKLRLENPVISPRFVNLLTIKTNFSQSEDLGYILVLHNLEQEMEIEKTEMNFVSSLIRELNSPLTLINQCFPFLKQAVPADTQNMYMTGLQLGIDQITLIMENLLLAAQLDQKTLSFTLQNIDITEVIKQTITMLAPQAQVKQITLTFEEPKEQIPNVSGDHLMVRDILLNLLANAIKFTPQMGTVTVTMHQFENEVFVQVQDTGVGIPKDAINNLFKKFYTVPNTEVLDATGTGLGLYLCKTLVELNHGKIWTDSVEGKGSTFGFSLPKATGN